MGAQMMARVKNTKRAKPEKSEEEEETICRQMDVVITYYDALNTESNQETLSPKIFQMVGKMMNGDSALAFFANLTPDLRINPVRMVTDHSIEFEFKTPIHMGKDSSIEAPIMTCVLKKEQFNILNSPENYEETTSILGACYLTYMYVIEKPVNVTFVWKRKGKCDWVLQSVDCNFPVKAWNFQMEMHSQAMEVSLSTDKASLLRVPVKE